MAHGDPPDIDRLLDDHVAEMLGQVVSHVEHVQRGLVGRTTTAGSARS